MNARPEVISFARAMEIKLSMNEKREPKYKEMPANVLYTELMRQVDKYGDMIASGKFKEEELLSVAANIGNYTMFLADNSGALGTELHNKLLSLK